MINLEEKHLEILTSIFSKYPYTFYAFGSRITPHAKKLSDLDLFYKEKIPESILSKLQEELEDSDLPFTVDLVDYYKCDETFKKILDTQYVTFNNHSKHSSR